MSKPRKVWRQRRDGKPEFVGEFLGVVSDDRDTGVVVIKPNGQLVYVDLASAVMEPTVCDDCEGDAVGLAGEGGKR